MILGALAAIVAFAVFYFISFHLGTWLFGGRR